MSDRMLVATRKGLITFARKGGGWSLARTDFPGVPVTAALPDRRDGALYAALNLGHFGIKLHRSDDGGAQLDRVAAPAYPRQAAEARRRCSRSGRWRPAAPDQPARSGPARCPGGLFRSDDRGESWPLVERAVGRARARRSGSAAATTMPGIHSICVDPRDPRRSHGRRSPAAASGRGRRRRQLDPARRRPARRLHAARAGRRARARRIRTASCAAPPRPTCCGASTTTASSARPTPA